MRAFLILVSLFISLGLSSGFIAPAGVIEDNNDLSTPRSLNENLPQSLKNSSTINETELFQTAEDKASNLSERSLIFINKKLKTLRRLPKNRFKGFQDFVGNQAPHESNRWIIDEKYPKKFVKAQQPENNKNGQGQLFDPNMELKKPQVQSLYRYVYPDLPKRNKTCLYEDQERATQMNETKPETMENIDQDVRYLAKPPMKLYDMKALEYFKNSINKATPKPQPPSVAPEQHSKNMVIKSYTNRKPKSNGRNCGFLKPNWLHRMTFNKNLEDKLNPLDVNSMDSYYLGDSYGDEKLDRYIKEALSELQIHVLKSENEDKGKQAMTKIPDKEINPVETTDQKLERLMEEFNSD